MNKRPSSVAVAAPVLALKTCRATGGRALPGTAAARCPPKIALLLTGGIHQSPHLLPLAKELRDIGAVVHVITLDPETAGFCRDFLLDAELGDVPVLELKAGLPGKLIRLFASASRLKRLRLIRATWYLRGFDAIVVAERTSTALRRYRLIDRPIIHIPHGAGDRRVGFDIRARAYDFHIVSGQKDRDRFISERIATAANIAVSGSIKLASMHRPTLPPARLFQQDRPVILYTPHFEPSLSSWYRIGLDLLQKLAEDGRYNVIFAPHIRLREKLSPADIACIEGLASQTCHIDLGSAKCCDLTYTAMADIYLGDVSSQVYEFLVRPRPCVFLNTIGAVVQDNPDFQMWLLGQVVSDTAGALRALARATCHHPEFIGLQRAAFQQSMGHNWSEAPRLAARQIADFLAWRHHIQPA
jgi:hypothetical protein